MTLTLDELVDQLRTALPVAARFDHELDLLREQGTTDAVLAMAASDARHSVGRLIIDIARSREAAAKAAVEAARYERAPDVGGKPASAATKRRAPVVAKKRAGGRR